MFQKNKIIILSVIINDLDSTYNIPNTKYREDLIAQFYMFRKEPKRKKNTNKTKTLKTALLLLRMHKTQIPNLPVKFDLAETTIRDIAKKPLIDIQNQINIYRQ